MNNKIEIVSYTLAAVAGFSFVCGLAILSGKGGF